MPTRDFSAYVYSSEDRQHALRSLARRCRDLAETAEFVADNDDDASGLMFALFDAVPVEIARVRLVSEHSPIDEPTPPRRKK